MKQVKIIGTIHDTHRINPNYTFEHLYDGIKRFDPQVIGVEIRQQDMLEDNGYLRQYYPPEMVGTKEMYEKKIEVFGFDWRGKQIEDRRIEDWRKMVPHLWHLMKEEEAFNTFVKERRALMHPFFETCTMEACQIGFDAQVEEEMTSKLNTLLKEHGHEALIEYYDEREARIQNNIISKIKAHQDKRLLVITGCAHRKALVNKIEEVLGDVIV